MFRYRIALQGRGNENAVINAIAAGAGCAEFVQARGAYAYASAGGASDYVHALKTAMPNWDLVDKRWLISFDFGHTEPNALELLASLPNSQVRVPYAREVLGRLGLSPVRAFHPKTLILTGSKVGRAPLAVALGSANMTVSGLRTGHEDVSVATWTGGHVGADARAQLKAAYEEAAWFDRSWRAATRLTESLLAEYRAKRPNRITAEDASRRVKEVEQDRPLPFEQIATLQSSRRLWVEVNNVAENLGSGRPGNQIHLRRGTRAFFGLTPLSVPKMTFLGTINIVYGGREIPRHMRYSHNGMDTLDLPLPGTDGPATYEHVVLVFDQVGPDTFTLRIASPSQAARLKATSMATGTLYTLSGGRQWGVVT